jgi:hypothetical protein
MSTETTTIYISIGNSDDKLPQAEWVQYYWAVHQLLRFYGNHIHGQWISDPISIWQNACWCIEMPLDDVITRYGRRVPRNKWLQERLSQIATEFHQDSISWAEIKETTLLKPTANLSKEDSYEQSNPA